ncbi:hypothetical protein Q6348_07215 [Isoptericola sp. b441]|uniref:Uncharacterized protein n=1 Tax=Actinotalea lenta TaxID=3064654 RepID=A0ABT9D944_9CELL|nr:MULTISPECIES: hypothetical protein [unclassified Isoptericola]MDO8106986.1 hypothetical protein [Isoptericola sp. b441]MDO8121304.1 hypothetical protein [Isoptericola sp. b490]
MERLIVSYHIGVHDVDVLETLDDDEAWYHLVVDGLARDLMLSAPPDPDEAAELILLPARGE